MPLSIDLENNNHVRHPQTPAPASPECLAKVIKYIMTPLPSPDLYREERTKGWIVPKMWQSEKKKHSSLPTSWRSCACAWTKPRAHNKQTSILSSPKTQIRPWEAQTVREWNFAQFWNVGHLRDSGTPSTFSHHCQTFSPWTRAVASPHGLRRLFPRL